MDAECTSYWKQAGTVIRSLMRR